MRDGVTQELTARERKILIFLVAGIDHDTITRDLGIVRSTTLTYLYRFMASAGASSRQELATWSIFMGIVTEAEILEVWAKHRPRLIAWWREGIEEGKIPDWRQKL